MTNECKKLRNSLFILFPRENGTYMDRVNPLHGKAQNGERRDQVGGAQGNLEQKMSSGMSAHARTMCERHCGVQHNHFYKGPHDGAKNR